MKHRTVLACIAASAFLALGCGPEERPYKAKAAYSGTKPNLPAVPTLENKAKKKGDAYTVWGASHDLRSIVHGRDFQGKKTSLVGWIVKTNYADAPECAIHKTGKADPADCNAPTPAFYIADEKDEKTAVIPVMGWASNFAQIAPALQHVIRQ